MADAEQGIAALELADLTHDDAIAVSGTGVCRGFDAIPRFGGFLG